MWHLKIKGGAEISEQQMRYWDNVPINVEIERLGLILPRANGSYYVIDLSGYERYCAARSVSTGFGGVGGEQGYCLYGMRGDQVSELEVLPSGMRMKSYRMDQCQLPERCWRQGVV